MICLRSRGSQRHSQSERGKCLLTPHPPSFLPGPFSWSFRHKLIRKFIFVLTVMELCFFSSHCCSFSLDAHRSVLKSFLTPHPQIFFFFSFLLETLPRHMEVPRLGVKLELQVPAYTTAYGNTGSLTHWARPGMEPETSWFLVGFISAVPRWELLEIFKCTQKWRK